MRGPPNCPNCGHDPTGDDDEFTSGGGWTLDRSITSDSAGLLREELLRCPVCNDVVTRNAERTGREL